MGLQAGSTTFGGTWKNAFVFDFWKHKNVEAIKAENGVHQSELYDAMKIFNRNIQVRSRDLLTIPACMLALNVSDAKASLYSLPRCRLLHALSGAVVVTGPVTQATKGLCCLGIADRPSSALSSHSGKRSRTAALTSATS